MRLIAPYFETSYVLEPLSKPVPKTSHPLDERE